MGDLYISLEKAIKGFFTAGGATLVATLLGQFPPEYVLYGTLTMGAIVGIWSGVTNAYKHWGDPIEPVKIETKK
jgi:hypothetical protein